MSNEIQRAASEGFTAAKNLLKKEDVKALRASLSRIAKLADADNPEHQAVIESVFAVSDLLRQIESKQEQMSRKLCNVYFGRQLTGN